MWTMYHHFQSEEFGISEKLPAYTKGNKICKRNTLEYNIPESENIEKVPIMPNFKSRKF